MRLARFIVSLCAFAALMLTGNLICAASSQGVPVAVGASTVALNGPWRFHVGDDPRWSSIDVDDSNWETVDLTPAPGAHDGDVGLPGYVSGWSLRGHPGYTGYAWYRIRVTVDGKGVPLALAGPTYVDSTYQLYIDGKRLGGPGAFSQSGPSAYSVRPRVFALPSSSTGAQTFLIAVRVWMDPVDAGADSGGIHIAPTIGSAEGIALLHQVQWLRTFNGYVLDAVEPIGFVLLALMVSGLMAWRSGERRGWLAIALILLALLRVNQVLYAWTPWQSLRCYDIATAVALKPLTLAAWICAWRDWFRLRITRWLKVLLCALVVISMVLALLGRPWFALVASDSFKMVANDAVEIARAIFLALYVWAIAQGLSHSIKPSAWLAAIAAILVGIGLFANELNLIGVPGIWFPFGVGVARGQYAYAAFIPLLFVLILMRFVARDRRPSGVEDTSHPNRDADRVISLRSR